MPMTLISRQTLTGTAASVTFSNIPQTFQTLKLVISARDNTSGGGVSNNIKMSFNGAPSGTAWSERLLYGTGSSALSASNTSQPNSVFQYATSNGATASTFSSGAIDLPNYTGATNKPVSVDSVTETNATGALQALAAELWASNSAITSIVLSPASGNFVSGSTFSLYGVS